jgi:uncharacterized membrane protein YqjE
VGLGRNIARLAAGSLVLLRQRLELASLELEEELLRIGLLLARALVTAILLALALMAAAATVVIYFWEAARVAAAVGVTGFFALAGVVMAWRLLSALRDKPSFLAATLAELDKDAQRLGGRP